MYYQISEDSGLHFSPVVSVNIKPEKISARNENRPKIGFDDKANKERGVYLSWASSLGKRFTSNIRFSYSTDYGQTFTDPVTVNDDGLITGHSFNEMQVNGEGDVSLVWLDSRLRFQAKQQKKEIKGSALYLGKSNPRQATPNQEFPNQESPNRESPGKASDSEEGVKFMFSNEMLANDTCVCCRIATDINQNGNMAVFWRHIFGDNIREFAIKTINEDAGLTQVSYDHWKIDGCPHQGGGISIDDTNRYHLVWFNQGDKGKGIFYAFSDDGGKNTTKPLAIGQRSASAAHPHIMSNQIMLNGKKHRVVDLVWTEFQGDEHQLWHQRSLDQGKSFGSAEKISSSLGGSDRPFLIKHGGESYVSWHRPKIGHWFHKL